MKEEFDGLKFLHNKENILSKEDAENLLKAIELLRPLTSSLKNPKLPNVEINIDISKLVNGKGLEDFIKKLNDRLKKKDDE